MKIWKFLTASTLFLFVASMAIAPTKASAAPMEDDMVKGKIRDIVGDIVSVEMEKGQIQTMSVGGSTMGSLGLREGLLVAIEDGEIVGAYHQPAIAPSKTSQAFLNRTDSLLAELKEHEGYLVTLSTPLPPQQEAAPPVVRALW